MCVDYRAINKLIVKKRYPLPRIEDLFDKLCHVNVFSSLNLAQGYHQIRITEEDVPKMAFITPFSHFQWRALSFEVINAPATFQRLMNNVFIKYMDDFVLVYLEHQEHLHKVLTLLI